jgi:MerR family transcriptional regulator/heat shock protein HspR
LRIYERKGLVGPARSGGGNRRYSDADIAQLHRIQELTNAGVNLEGVKRILALEQEAHRLELELGNLREDLRAAIERTHRLYRRDLVPVRAEYLPVRRRS